MEDPLTQNTLPPGTPCTAVSGTGNSASNTPVDTTSDTPPLTKVSIDKVGMLCRPLPSFWDWVETKAGTATTKTSGSRVLSTCNAPGYGHFATRRNGEYVVYTFNPNVEDEWEIAEALSHLEPERITRIDIAIDIRRSFGQCEFRVPRYKRQTFARPTGTTESMAFGRRGNTRYVRAYDKGVAR